MRRIGVLAAVGIGILFAGCTDGGEDQTSVTTPPPTTSSASALDEPVVLVLEDAGETLLSWAISPDRTAVAYVLNDGDGAKLRVVGGHGEPMTLAEPITGAYPIFLNETRLVLQGDSAGSPALQFATTQAAGVADVTQSSMDSIVFAGATDSELIFAETSDRASNLLAWSIDSATTRTIAAIEHRNGGVEQAKVVGEYVVYSLGDGKSWHLRSASIADGQTQDLPRHDDIFGFSILGAAHDPNTVVLTENGSDGDFIYTVDLDDPQAMTDLTRRAHAAGAVHTGDTVQFINRAGHPHQIDLESGAISDLPPELNRRSTQQSVVGLRENASNLRAALPNGNWLVTGFPIDGRTYESVWNRGQAFGGGQTENEASVRALFEYNPASEKLWQISGPPTYAASSTVSGSGVGPSWVLRVAAMDGFVVYSTGFSGAAYDLEYNLYLAPLPSGLLG